MNGPYRFWIADPTEGLIEVAPSWAVDAAMDLAMDAGLDMEWVTPMILAADRPGSPLGPEALVRKLVELRKAVR